MAIYLKNPHALNQLTSQKSKKDIKNLSAKYTDDSVHIFTVKKNNRAEKNITETKEFHGFEKPLQPTLGRKDSLSNPTQKFFKTKKQKKPETKQQLYQ